MDFRILGPLEVLDDERPLDVGGGKQRSVLALLLLHRNQVVPTDRLIDELWSDERPRTAQTALHGYVGKLRRLLGRDRLVTHGAGYLLRVDGASLNSSETATATTHATRPAATTTGRSCRADRGTPRSVNRS